MEELILLQKKILDLLESEGKLPNLKTQVRAVGIGVDCVIVYCDPSHINYIVSLFAEHQFDLTNVKFEEMGEVIPYNANEG